MQSATFLAAGSAALPAVSALGNWMISNKHTTGWLLITVIQFGWIAYGTLTTQWGFVGWGIVFLWINGRGWIRWRRADNALHAEATAGPEPAQPTASA